ncbi:MAG: type 4a pilus biogenesis protein PilO [Candidatus Omnitrophica bacterium]|nr:type 4a pilus biogenesis protein PilO [Candidatus Omnitrophota bacterium]
MNLLDRLELDKKKIVLVILGIVLLFYLDFNFLLKLQFRKIKGATIKITKLKKDINTLNKDLEAMKARQQNLQKTALKAKRIISEEKIPALLENIADMANKNNVIIISMAHSRDPRTKEVKLKLDLSSNYHRLGRFINAIENAEVFMAVEGLEIVREQSNYLLQNVKLLLKTYVKK